MKINQNVLSKVKKAQGMILPVTKYFDPQVTRSVWEQLKNEECVLALGENRIDEITDKALPREAVHFIGNIQSRKIRDILAHCTVIHSLCDLNHAMTIDKEIQKQKPSEKYSVFLQVNISNEPQKSGIMIKDFPSFLKEIQKLEHINIRGISAIGAGEFDENVKRKEFQKLNEIRDDFLPSGEISAGTSRDYEIALEEGIDIVRVGTALFN